ncbi:MAG: YggU family protein [Methanosarcinaceae archaeon]|nr:YggU family protein [Methanosarcinaceae archaeon]
MSFEDAFKETDNGMIIDVEVTPGSKKICIPSGYNPWRKRIEVRLSENARKGKANEQLVENLAVLFGLNSSEVSISNGHKSTKKSVLLKGIDRERAVSVLKKGLEVSGN